jgi:hypothetical protein
MNYKELRSDSLHCWSSSEHNGLCLSYHKVTNAIRGPYSHRRLLSCMAMAKTKHKELSHLIAPWIAITTAHVTTEVLIITKSGIAVDLVDFAMASYL